MTRCYICDVDGTIADITHRLRFLEQRPKDWGQFFATVSEDLPVSHMRTMLYHLLAGQKDAMEPHQAVIVYASGRPERTRMATEAWLFKHQFPPGKMYMRADGDRRDDDIVKKEILDQILADGFEPIMAFDDRDRVVAMWRRNGIPCAQVKPGDF